MEKMSSSEASLLIYREFTIGFWHPFGMHAGEATDHILRRKASEAEGNGYTIWSFAGPKRETVLRWRRKVEEEGTGKVFGFCSSGKNSRDPNPEPFYCKEYSVDGIQWEKIPDGVMVPHPRSERRINIVGYFVKRVIAVEPFRPAIKVLYEKKADGGQGHFWKAGSRLPGQSNSLIKRTGGEGTPLRAVAALLELEYPYVVMLR